MEKTVRERVGIGAENNVEGERLMITSHLIPTQAGEGREIRSLYLTVDFLQYYLPNIIIQ